MIRITFKDADGSTVAHRALDAETALELSANLMRVQKDFSVEYSDEEPDDDYDRRELIFLPHPLDRVHPLD